MPCSGIPVGSKYSNAMVTQNTLHLCEGDQVSSENKIVVDEYNYHKQIAVFTLHVRTSFWVTILYRHYMWVRLVRVLCIKQQQCVVLPD